MAPEQLAGNRVTAAADMWSWAVSMTFAGTGKLPYTGESLTAMAFAILHGEPSVGTLPEPLGSLVRHCLNKDPAARPSARDALSELVAAGAQPMGPLPPQAVSVAADDAAGVIEVDALRLEFHWGAGDFSALIEGGVPLIETALAMGNAAQAARIMMRVAGAARLSGRLDLAAHYIAEARAIGRRFGLRALLRDVRSSEATAAWFTGDSGAALEILEEVRAEAVGDGDGNRLVGTARRRSDILEGDGRYAEAVTRPASSYSVRRTSRISM